MKKSFLALIPLAALMALTGCDKQSYYTVPDPKDPEHAPEPYKPSRVPTEILLNSGSETMFVGETFQLEPLVTPLMASDSELLYSSSNSSIASVSDTGFITARAEGTATITVKAKEDEDVKASIKINVFNLMEADNEEYKAAFDATKAYHNEHVKDAPIEKLKVQEVKSFTLYKNGKIQSISTQFNTIISSSIDSYVYYGGRDTFQNIEDGSTSRDFGGFHFYTDKDYHSYVYHDTDNYNRYLYVGTEFNLGTEYTRFDTLCTILDSFFTLGRKLITNNFDDSKCSEKFDRTPVSGSFKEETDLVACYHNVYKEKSIPLYEQNLNIPAGVDLEETEDYRIHWYMGRVQTYYNIASLAYSIGTDDYVLVIEDSKAFSRDSSVSVKLPDRSKYDKVDSVYDL